jgi:DNA polymerase-3 subunit gamma/tau
MGKKKYSVKQNLPARHRPKSLKEIAGNFKVKRDLKSLFEKGYIPNSIIISGPSGSGKTTLARIIANTINCQNPSSDHSPCDECISCKELPRERMCVHEVDCAGKRGVKDMNNVIKLTPLFPRFNFRVIILDEIQAASKVAVSALLKPLEDSPPNTVWILCTTDHDLLPEMIIGRCKHFYMIFPKPKALRRRLRVIAKREFEKWVVDLMAPHFLRIAEINDCKPRFAIELLEEIGVALSGNKKARKDQEVAEKIIRESLGRAVDKKVMQKS